MNEITNPHNLTWKSKYNVNNYKIDSEHQILFNIARTALAAQVTDNNYVKEVKQLKDIIKSLYDYVAKHFKHEEEYMESENYPDLNRHKKLHKELLENLHISVQNFNNLKVDEIKHNVYKFINDYFVKHIIEEDTLIGLWINPLDKIRQSTKWNQDYNTGNPSMDDEHQKIFQILEKAFEKVSSENTEEKIKETLTKLYMFMKKHFKVEEKYMRDIQYPEYEKHKEVHDQFIDKTNELFLQLKSLNSKIFEKKLAKFIDEEIITHMIDEDKKIVEFANKR